MDARLPALHEILKLNTRLFRNVLEGVDDEMADGKPVPEASSAIFIACHLMEARYALAGGLGSEMVAPYRDLLDVTDVADIQEYPPLAGVMAAWEEVSAELARLLPEATEEVLGASPPYPFPVDDKTILGGIAFLLEHESYHIGQLSILRRALGLEAMRWD